MVEISRRLLGRGHGLAVGALPLTVRLHRGPERDGEMMEVFHLTTVGDRLFRDEAHGVLCRIVDVSVGFKVFRRFDEIDSVLRSAGDKRLMFVFINHGGLESSVGYAA